MAGIGICLDLEVLKVVLNPIQVKSVNLPLHVRILHWALATTLLLVAVFARSAKPKKAII